MTGPAIARDIFSYVDPSPASSSGPLGGLSVVIQPNLSVRGWPTEAGSVALERFVALEDAAAVERLRASGAKIVGSSRMAELGFGLLADTTARAVAEGACDAALVTDTMGEARVAASMAAAVGFKPSHGIVSRFGLIGLVPSMECCGVVAKSAAQAAELMAAIAGPDERDASMPQVDIPNFTRLHEQHHRIAVVGVPNECIEALDAGDADAWSSALARLEAAGVRVERVSLTDLDLFRTVHNVVGSAEASSSAGKYDGVRYGHRTSDAENWNEMYLKSRAEAFGLLVKTYLFQGAYFQFENYAAFENACRIRRRLVRQAQSLFKTVDALVCPTRRCSYDAAAASTIREVYNGFALTLPANVTGQPSVSVPGLVRRGDADLGLQIVGPYLADVRLLQLAQQLS